MRDPVTGKLMRVYEIIACPYCTITPEQVGLTFTGVQCCPDCFNDGSIGKWFKWSFTDTFNGVEWILDRQIEAPCSWILVSEYAILRQVYYHDEYCTEFSHNVDHKISFGVDKIGADISISVMDEGLGWGYLFIADYVPDSDCLNKDNILTEATCELHLMGFNGSCDVVDK